MLLKVNDVSHASSDNRDLNIRDCGDLLYCINHQICKYRFFSSLSFGFKLYIFVKVNRRFATQKEYC